MRLAIVSPENGFDENNNGGIGTYFEIVSRALARRGHVVHAVSVHGLADRSAAVAEGLRLHLVSGDPAGGAKARERLRQGFAQILERIARDEGLDVVELPEWLGYGERVVARCGVASVTRLHTPLSWIERVTGNGAVYADQAALCAAEAQQVRQSTLCVAPCAAMADVGRSLFGVAAQVVPNMAAPGEERSSPRPPRDGFHVVFLGRLEFRKGVHILAPALRDFLAAHPKARATLCGRDSLHLRRSIRADAKAVLTGFEDRVCFIEHAAPSARRDLLEDADVLAIPSLWENFPYAALEAMALGVPVVATAAGGLPELVGDAGILVAPGDPSAFAAGLGAAFARRGTWSAAAIRRQAAQFGAELLVPRYEALYAQAIAMHAGAARGAA